MVILGIDTSSTDLSVSLCVNDEPISNICRYVRNSHAEHITQAVKSALLFGNIDVNQITHIAVSTGPGSFTGLRIGLSFIKGLCMMAERKILPLSSLTVLAHAVNSNRCTRKKIFTALDARQGRIHWAGFVCGDNERTDTVRQCSYIRRITDDKLSLPEELLNELSVNDLLITDAIGYSRSAVFKMFEGKAEIINAEKSALSRGYSCAALAYYHRDDNTLWQSAHMLVPNYLQMSAAEEKAALC